MYVNGYEVAKIKWGIFTNYLKNCTISNSTQYS